MLIENNPPHDSVPSVDGSTKWTDLEPSITFHIPFQAPNYTPALSLPSESNRLTTSVHYLQLPLQRRRSFRTRVSASMMRSLPANTKFATPPSTMIFPIRSPEGAHTFRPSPQPLYTLPSRSHFTPSGMPATVSRAQSPQLLWPHQIESLPQKPSAVKFSS